jgi:D-xylose transport system permease protein
MALEMDRNKTGDFIKKYTMVIALLIIWIIFGLLTKIIMGDFIFFSARNISNLFRQMTIIGLLACGMVMVIVSGGIDLSVGSVTGFISAVVARVQYTTMPLLFDAMHINLPSEPFDWNGLVITIIALISGLAVGLAVGLFQGSIIAYLSVPAFIVTLGGMILFRGGVLGVTQGKTIQPIEDYFRLIAQGYVPKFWGWVIAFFVVVSIFAMILYNRKKKSDYGFPQPALYIDLIKASVASVLVLLYTFIMNRYRGIQNPVLLLAGVAVVMHYITQNTRFGRYVYALGGNKEATRLSGINIQGNIFKVHILMGLLCGFAGIVLTGYVAAGTTGGGLNYELEAIASCVIGGTSLMGGSGTVMGAIIGALVMASLMNGMSVLNMPIFWQYIVKGLILVIAVLFDIQSKKKTA